MIGTELIASKGIAEKIETQEIEIIVSGKSEKTYGEYSEFHYASCNICISSSELDYQNILCNLDEKIQIDKCLKT